MRKHLFSAALFLTTSVMLLIVFYPSDNAELRLTSAPKNAWTERSSPGELTQELNHFAVSARTAPRLQMRYPYNQMTASIGFGCDNTDEWMYVAFSEAPNIANVESLEEVNLFSANMTFDVQTSEYEMTQKFGSRFLHFREDDAVSAQISQSSSMTFEIQWHREGRVQFAFPLDGSADAIASARAKCAAP